MCWNDPSAPLESTVLKTSVKYEVEHPALSQLEVQLVHDGVQEPVVLWDNRKAAEGVEEFGEAAGMETFAGSPGAGNWYLQVRDTVAGDSGKLTGMTIHNTYFLEGLMPAPEGAEGVEPSAMRLPPDAVPSSAPDLDPPKIEIESLQDIKSETFEGAFPNANWSLYDYSSDGYNRLWDDANSRSHNGSWAGWPANGGVDFIDPVINPVYPPNMDSWMVYGPFDLSDAVTAEVVFWLWRQIEATYDYLFVGVSANGVDYQGFKYYGNGSQVYNWSEITVAMNNYTGDSSVWVTWKFYSDINIQYEGPWVDDIVIRKEAPGNVTVNGTLTYEDRDSSTKNGRFTSVALYEDDPGGSDDFLALTSTNGNGYYSFPPLLNWDDDGDAANRNLDLYVVFEAIYFDNENAGTYHTVRDSGWESYVWDSLVYSNAPSTNITRDLHISSSDDTLRAMWILQDLRNGWQYIYNQSAPYSIDPGSVDAIWENGLNCYPLGGNDCNAYSIPGYLFIPNSQVVSADIVVHEAGHRYLINANGLYAYGFCPNPHNLTEASNTFCAYNEGWPNFLAIVVNLEQSSTDVCYDFTNGHCVPDSPTGIIRSVNLETLPSNDSDDVVEGWVAGALLDLFDSANEGAYDSASFGFNEIAKVSLQGVAENEFSDFWYYWKDSNFEKHNAVRAIYQNTINYNTPPVLSLPDWSVPHDSSWPNAFNVSSYVSDEESPATYMTWEIYWVSDARCGVSIDSQKNVDIAPLTQWTGSCVIAVRANDTIDYGYDTFTVYVTQASFADVPPAHSVYAQIESIFSAGITGGCANNPRRYCPNNPVDRSQMAVFLLRGIHGGGYAPPPASGTMFNDVPANHPYAAWIEQFANEGITSGCGGGNYCPSNNVTRAQMAIFLLRSEHGSAYVPPPATGTMFADVPINAFAADWIEQLANEGISSGCGGGNFCPNDPVTRAQMAVFLVNTFNLP